MNGLESLVLSHADAAISIGIGVIGGIVIRARLWWWAKPVAVKRQMILDGAEALADGRLTAKEFKALVTKYL